MPKWTSDLYMKLDMFWKLQGTKTVLSESEFEAQLTLNENESAFRPVQKHGQLSDKVIEG